MSCVHGRHTVRDVREFRSQGDGMTDSITDTTDVATVDMTAGEARTLTEQIRTRTGELCHLLRGAYEQRAHHALGYSRWEDYVEAEFGMGRVHSYRLLTQSRVLGELQALAPAESSDVVLSEREVRDIGSRLPEVIEAVRERRELQPGAEFPAMVREVVAAVRATPVAAPVVPVHGLPTPVASADDDGEPAPDPTDSAPARHVLGALYELPVTIRRLQEGLLFEIVDPGHPLQGWCGGPANDARMVAAVLHDLLTEAKKCEADLRAGKFYAPLGEVISGKPRESTYDPADYTPLPDGRWLTPSGRKYAAESWVMRQVLTKRAQLGLPIAYTHGDDTAA